MSDAIKSGGPYREQAEATIADLRARVSHYEALLVAMREETLTKAALAVDHLFMNVRAFDESWDRGYRQGVQDSAYAVRELRTASASSACPADMSGHHAFNPGDPNCINCDGAR